MLLLFQHPQFEVLDEETVFVISLKGDMCMKVHDKPPVGFGMAFGMATVQNGELILRSDKEKLDKVLQEIMNLLRKAS